MPFIIAAVCFSFFKPHRRLWDNAFDVLHLLLLAKVCPIFHYIFEMPISESTTEENEEQETDVEEDKNKQI